MNFCGIWPVCRRSVLNLAIIVLAAPALAALPSLLSVSCSSALAGELGEGADVEFGGFGDGQGTFRFLRDFAFGPEGQIYVLDGAEYNHQDKAVVGNLLVQQFDHQGKISSRLPESC